MQVDTQAERDTDNETDNDNDQLLQNGASPFMTGKDSKRGRSLIHQITVLQKMFLLETLSQHSQYY